MGQTTLVREQESGGGTFVWNKVQQVRIAIRIAGGVELEDSDPMPTGVQQ